MKILALFFLILILPLGAGAHLYVCEVAPTEVAYVSFIDSNHFSLIDSGHTRTGDYTFKSSVTLPGYGAVDYFEGGKPALYLKAGMNDMTHPIEEGFIMPSLHSSLLCSLAR